jgi:hypothetical protein
MNGELQPRRQKSVVGGAGLIALLVVLFGAFAPSAQGSPSRFIYEVCDPALPGGSPATITSFPPPSVINVAPFDTCASPDGSLGLERTGATPIPAQAVVSVPETPGGYVESETMIGKTEDLGESAQQSWIFEPGWPVEAAGESRRSFYLRGEPSSIGNSGDFRMELGCEGVPPCPVGPQVGARYIAATEVDPNPPTLTSVTGSLLAPGVLRGHQGISAEFADLGGGVAKMEVLVNGASAAAPTSAPCAVAQVSNASINGAAAASPAPCPPTYGSSWNLDTAAYPFQEGSNSVQVCAADFASFGEANRTCSPTQSLTVDNSCTESPVAGGSTLSTRFSSSDDDEVTVPYDTSAKVSGELTNQAGEAISGATICVQQAIEDSGTAPAPAGTTTTDANGRFVYAIPAGPNRSVLFGYRHDSFQIANSMRYFAHVRPTIKLSPRKVKNGGVVRITGRVPGGSAAAGRVVVLKASALHSKKWFPFGETTTNADGTFHSHYRFDGTTRTTVYRMEADVPHQDHFPWKAGHSKPARVEVRAKR